MIISITKSSNPKYWYSKYIGKRFHAIRSLIDDKTQIEIVGIWGLYDPEIRFFVDDGDFEITEPELKKVVKTLLVIPEWQKDRLSIEAKIELRQILQEADQLNDIRINV